MQNYIKLYNIQQFTVTFHQCAIFHCSSIYNSSTINVLNYTNYFIQIKFNISDTCLFASTISYAIPFLSINVE